MNSGFGSPPCRATLDDIAARHVASLSDDDLEALELSQLREALRGRRRPITPAAASLQEAVEEAFVRAW